MANIQIEALKTALAGKQAPPRSSSTNKLKKPILQSTIVPSDLDDDLLSPGNLGEIASFLQLCPDPVTLQILRTIYPPNALTTAARVLRQQDAEAFDRIKQWRQEQDRGYHPLPEVRSHIRGKISQNVPPEYCAAWQTAQAQHPVFVLGEQNPEKLYWVVVAGELTPFVVPVDYFIEDF